LDEAGPGQAVTLVLSDEIDVSRGDVLADAEAPAEITDQFAAHVIWMAESEMLPERQYLLKLGTRTVGAVVTELKHKVNVNTLEHMAGKTLELNEVGSAISRWTRRSPTTLFRQRRDRGASS
jgi:bifunctional enzyme CysN/CysC